MSLRTEFTEQVVLGGYPASLFASSGSWDDYIELELAEPDGNTLPRLATLSDGGLPDGLELDVQLRGAPPTAAGILALYLGEQSETRHRSQDERLAAILHAIDIVLPGCDFGDLLPKSFPQDSSSQTATASAISAAPAEPKDTIPPVRVTGIKSADLPTPPRLQTVNPEAAAACVQKAKELAARGQLHKALRIVDDALRYDRRNQEAKLLKDELRILEKRLRQAQRQANSPRALLECGFSFLRLDSDLQAVSYLERAAGMDPRLFLAHVLLGIGHHRLGHVEAAQQAYQQGFVMRPNDQVVVTLQQALARGESPPPLVETSNESLWPPLPANTISSPMPSLTGINHRIWYPGMVMQ